MKHLRFLAVLTAIMLFAVACTSDGGASPDDSEAPTDQPGRSAKSRATSRVIWAAICSGQSRQV